jgi:hypothetical protein
MLQHYKNWDAIFYQAKMSMVYVIQIIYLTFIGKKEPFAIKHYNGIA